MKISVVSGLSILKSRLNIGVSAIKSKKTINATKTISKKIGIVFGLLAGATIRIFHGVSRVINKSKGTVSAILIRTTKHTPPADSQVGFPDSPITQKFPNKRKLIIGLAVFLLAIITLSIIVTGYTLWQRKNLGEAEELVVPYVNRLSQATQLAKQDPVRGREQLSTLQEEVQSLQAQQTPGTTKRDVVDDLLNQVSDSLDQVIGSSELTAVPVWLDVQSQAPSFVTSTVSSIPGKMFMMDSQQKKGFLVDFATKQTDLVDLTTAPAINALTLRSSDELLTLGKGIHSVSLPSGKPEELKPEGDSNRDGNLLSSFDSFVYVFNPAKRNIYRYILKDGKLSDPIGWLVSPLGVAADTVHNMAVDGDVWLTTTNGELKKYSSGRSTSFQMTALPEPLEGPLSVVATADQTYLYVFVPNQGRVVVLTKDGTFVKQIKSNVLSGATGVAVDEPQNQLYAVSGSVIYQVPIL